MASPGDSGAYDVYDAFNHPVNDVISADSPASGPAIHAAGGTTLPFTVTLTSPPPNMSPLIVSTQQVWAWDYLQNYLVKYLGPKYENALFPVVVVAGVGKLPDQSDR